MNPIDIIALALLAVCVIYGLYRGFIQSVLNLGGSIIALLGSLNVYGIIASACFFSILLCGGASMQRMTSVPYSVVNIIQGLIIILVIARTTFSETVSKLFKGRKEKANVK